MIKELSNIVIQELREVIATHPHNPPFYDCADCNLMRERIKQLLIVVEQYAEDTQEDLPSL